MYSLEEIFKKYKAAELIAERANASKANMGLTT